MSCRMSVRVGVHPSRCRVISEEMRLSSERLIPEPTLDGGEKRLPILLLRFSGRSLVVLRANLSAAFMPSISINVRLSVCSPDAEHPVDRSGRARAE